MDFFTFHQQITQRKTQSSPPASQVTRAAPPGALPKRDILTVTQLTTEIDNALKDCLPVQLLVRGEVSNFKRHAQSGHTYFTLKDERCCINCVMWKSDGQRLKFTPQDGMELLATGSVGVYGEQGKYQLYVSRLEPLGKGALEFAFQQLRSKLQANRLFDAQRKKLLPPFPRRIALVTSRGTAALADMLKVLRRFAWLNVMICHVPVQGDGAAERIARAIGDLNRASCTFGGIDLMVLARGGGSLEDLWAFNEEIVARAIAASRIPIITGIGHEIDVTIADLVADHHAHTPTEAAQVITANWRSARDALDAGTLRLRRAIATLVQEARGRLREVRRHECFRRPLDRVNQFRQLLDERRSALDLVIITRMRRALAATHHFSSRVAAAGQACVRLKRQQITRLQTCLLQRHPRHAIALGAQRLETLRSHLARLGQQSTRLRRLRLDSFHAHLNAVGPEQVLRRGYTITTFKKGGAVVRAAAEIGSGDRLVTRFADGTVESTAQDSKQLSLFD